MTLEEHRRILVEVIAAKEAVKIVREDLRRALSLLAKRQEELAKAVRPLLTPNTEETDHDERNR